jgi:chorismate mutase
MRLWQNSDKRGNQRQRKNETLLEQCYNGKEVVEAELNIEDWRDEIDRLDEQLVKLLNARSQCAIELGRIKRELGLAIYSPDREREVIAHVTGINPGPLDKTAIRRLFERIIDESRRIERVTVEKETKDGSSTKRKKRPKD